MARSWHDGFPHALDLREHRGHIDMQKIMMAVLVAMQEERDRKDADAAAAAAVSSSEP